MFLKFYVRNHIKCDTKLYTDTLSIKFNLLWANETDYALSGGLQFYRSKKTVYK